MYWVRCCCGWSSSFLVLHRLQPDEAAEEDAELLRSCYLMSQKRALYAKRDLAVKSESCELLDVRGSGVVMWVASKEVHKVVALAGCSLVEREQASQFTSTTSSNRHQLFIGL
jgi:hypothetical protein